MSASPTPNQVRLWANLALAVLDIETTQNARGGYRIVDVAIVLCRRGVPVSRYTQWLNPEIPIDAKSAVLHGITDEAAALAPVIADIADQLLSQLTQQAGERLVVVCHNARFDIPILRDELIRAGRALPTLPVLDTAKSNLAGLVGVSPQRRSLTALCSELGVAHTGQHQASTDAHALALAACRLLDRAAEKGHTDIAAILDQVGTSTDDYQNHPAHITAMASRSPQVSAAHGAAHSQHLGAQPSQEEEDAWQATIEDCAELRCEDTSSFVGLASTPPATLLALIDKAIAAKVRTQDTAGVATLIGAGLEPLRAILTATPNTRSRRLLASRRYDTWTALLGPLVLRRCQTSDPDPDPCPECLDYLPCPLDTWTDIIAAEAVGHTDANANSFYPVQPKARSRKTATYYNWTRQGQDPLAASGIAAVIAHWTAAGQLLIADRITEAAWNDGCRHPVVATRWAEIVSGPGQSTELRKARAVCDQVLKTKTNATSPAWTQLERTRRRIDAWLSRQTRPQATRQRRPAHPRRHHPRRFSPPPK